MPKHEYMKLSKLLYALQEGNLKYESYGPVNKEILDLTNDSRNVKKASLFVAIKGLHSDGHNFIDQTISLGVSCVVGEQRPKREWGTKITYIKVNNSRQALGLIASAWYGYPSRKLKVIGVTGTDGKTTTANLIHYLLTKTGSKAGLVSTIGAKIGDKEYETGPHVTNPDPIPLQELLKKMVNQKCEYAVIEITSHGLDQERVAGVSIDSAVLTNISHEHLDYHKTRSNYRNAKAKLFKLVKRAAVLNKDDESYEFIMNVVPAKAKLITYGVLEKNADIFAQNIRENSGGTVFELVDGVDSFTLKTKLLGDYNVSNILAAIAIVRQYRVDISDIDKVLYSFKAPIGRMEKITGTDFEIYVDFAHTPNSLEKVLGELRKKLDQKKSGKLISVFGCAGERDKMKRSLMGEISAKYADVSIFTAEDPRSEDVSKIILEMVKGARKTSAKEIEFKYYDDSNHRSEKKHIYIKVPERGEAIGFAIQRLAKKGDILVICGKGHEKSMAYDNLEHAWSDQEAIAEAMRLDDNMTAIVLAGGKGTRMNSGLPKVLHKIAGRPMLSYTLNTLRKAGFGKLILVVGYKSNKVIKTIGPTATYAYQPKQLGTGDAFAKGLKCLPAKLKEVVVLNGDDSAFYSPQTISDIVQRHKKSDAKITFVSLTKQDPFGLGRVIRDKNRKALGIVEEKNASSSEKKIKEVNIGFYVFNSEWARKNVEKIQKSPVGEYYIVDLIKMAIKQGQRVEVYELKNKDEWVGVNTLGQLEEADKKMRKIISSSFKDSAN